jgi:DNA invertase Pin-like site-specific DNA recombinase
MSKPAPPRAYSYLRFSSPEQGKGDSLRRQIAMSEAWCAKHGLVLDERLRLTDKGVSAFHGKNSTEGALGAFLRAVERGDVPKGSYLLVESLDRLSREEVSVALEMFLGLIRRGITVVTLVDEMVYTQKSINDLGSIITSIVIMSRAHEESAMKAMRLAATWVHKRRPGAELKMTARAPAWLRLAADRKSFEVIPERAEVVNKMFRDSLKGIGKFRITAALNASGYEPWGEKGRKGTKWHSSYIDKILANEAVIGRFQPHKMVGRKRVKEGTIIEGYFPTIVLPDIFYQVQAKRRERPLMPGRVGIGLKNLFARIAKCALTGKPALFHDKGPKWKYIRSDGVLADGRKPRSWPYKEFESLFLGAIGGLDLAAIFGEDRSALDAARGAVATAEAKFAEAGQRVDQVFKFVANFKGTPPSDTDAQLAAYALDRDNYKEAVAAARRDLDQAEMNRNVARRATHTLLDLMARPPDVTMRLALRAEIRRIVQRIEITFEVIENAEERAEREGLEAFAKLARKAGARVLASADGDIPKRSLTIVFTNGVRRTVVEGQGCKPFVYEADENGTDFAAAVVLLDPTETPPVKRAEPTAEPTAAPTSVKTKAKPSKKK